MHTSSAMLAHANTANEQDDEVIQYTSEPPAGALPQTPSLWRGRSMYVFNHNIYAQKP